MLEPSISLTLVPLQGYRSSAGMTDDSSKLRTLRKPDVGHASLAPMLSLSTRFAQGTVVQDRPASLKTFTDV